MERLLYIGDNPNKVKNGGDWVNQRNIFALKTIYKENFHTYSVMCKNSFKTFANLLRNYMLGLSPHIVKEITKYIRDNNIDSIFLSTSKFGKLAKILRKEFPNLKIYVFFHNIEKQYTTEEVRINPTWKNKFIAKKTAYNEALSCEFADKIILLNQRDNLLLNKLYGKTANILLPTTFIDKFESGLKTKNATNRPLTLLFVGFAFFANIEGVTWFIKNILPHLQNCKLQVVGNGMNQIFTSSDNLEVYGYVDDLASFYYNADIVVLPIFSGGGMKTKTAEALMYGCPIIGTQEAFEGYNIDYNKIGGLANTKEEMIASINRLKNNPILIEKASKYARTIFKQSYSIQTTIETLKENLLLS